MEYFHTITDATTGEQTVQPYTQEEIDEMNAPIPKDIQKENRRVAYLAEADPLFFKAQRGEATFEEWEAKIAEIKLRYPYPAE